MQRHAKTTVSAARKGFAWERHALRAVSKQGSGEIGRFPLCHLTNGQPGR